jgi:hypothetical protein
VSEEPDKFSTMMFDDASSFVAMIPNAPSERVGRAAFVPGARRKHRWSPRDENRAFIPGESEEKKKKKKKKKKS